MVGLQENVSYDRELVEYSYETKLKKALFSKFYHL